MSMIECVRCMHQGNDFIGGKCPMCDSKNLESDEAFFGDWINEEVFMSHEEIEKEDKHD